MRSPPVPDDANLAQSVFGARLRVLPTAPDARGRFTEMFCESWGLPIRPAQWSVVATKPRVLRRMHCHRSHDEYFALLRGRGCVGLYDLRPASPTAGRSILIDVDSAACVVFPRGGVHGWYFHEDSLHLQATSAEHADYHPADNWGCLWSDPELGLDWPDRAPVVSERAAAFPPLAKLRRRLTGM